MRNELNDNWESIIDLLEDLRDTQAAAAAGVFQQLSDLIQGE